MKSHKKEVFLHCNKPQIPSGSLLFPMLPNNFQCKCYSPGLLQLRSKALIFVVDIRVVYPGRSLQH